MPAPRTITVTRYVTPLREGGSLPAIVEADDDGLYVLKFRGAGLNLAIDYLPGSVTFDPIAHTPAPDLAARIVWFDAFVTNIDRTVRNTNMLMWNRRLWLIDHGATLYFHHADGWDSGAAAPRAPFRLIDMHVLRAHTGALTAIDEEMTGLITPGVIGDDAERLRALDPDVDLDAVRAGLDSILRICAGGASAGPMGDLPARGRFRWLASPRSTIIQMSRVHTGRTCDPVGTLDRLLETIVRRTHAGPPRASSTGDPRWHRDGPTR